MTAPALHASTASRICAVEGFIDCPPATTCCTPRLVNKRRTPSPTPTATTPVVRFVAPVEVGDDLGFTDP